MQAFTRRVCDDLHGPCYVKSAGQHRTAAGGVGVGHRFNEQMESSAPFGRKFTAGATGALLILQRAEPRTSKTAVSEAVARL